MRESSADCRAPAAPVPTARRRASGPSAIGVLALVASALVVLVPGAGLAQDDPLAAARALYDEARFAEAIEAFDAALEREVLPVDDVARALDRIAVSAFALGRARALDEALVRLVVVDPEHVFGPEVPPPVLDRFAALQDRPPSLELALERAPVVGDASRALTTLRLRGEPLAAVRALVLRCGSDEVARGLPAATLALEHDAARPCEAVAEGPGGVPVARAEHPGAPGSGEIPAAVAASSGLDPLLLGLSIGGGVLALGLVVGLAAGLSGSGPSEALVQVGVEW